MTERRTPCVASMLAWLAVAGVVLKAQTSWSQQPGLPPGTSGGYLAYDAGRDRLVCSSLGSSNWLEFDGSSWQVISSNPNPSIAGMMAYDDNRQVLVMYANNNGVLETWERSGVAWSLASTSAPVFESMAFHSGRGRVMAFGGGANFQLPGNDLYEWDGVNWTLVPTTSAPPRLLTDGSQMHYGGIVHDQRRDEVCIFGAVRVFGTSGLFQAQTWEWDVSNGWVPRNGGGPSTFGYAYFDTQRGMHMLVTRTGANQYQAWEWDGVGQWAQTGTALGPLTTPLSAPRVVYDTKRGRALMMLADGSMWSLASTSPALYEAHGPGCAAGSAGPDLVLTSPWTRAWVDGTAAPGHILSLDAVNLPQSLALLAMGFSDQNSGATPLPVDLAAYGMPGCFLRVAPDATRLLVGGGGQANFQLVIPHTNALVGQSFFVQAFVPAASANPAGMLAAPSYRGTVGFLH